jgi:hypothetical protein
MYAASNNLIILYPMADFCWDSKGSNFTGLDKYATKDGLQPKAIMNMIKRLTTPKPLTNKNLTNLNYA